MDLKYDMNAIGNVAVITVLGNCDVSALAEIMRSVTSDSLFNPKTKIIIDKSQVTSPPTKEEAYNLAEVIASNFKGHQVVTVAPGACLFGMNRMISTLSEIKGCQLRVVKTFSEAISCL
jgi:hypothetical protein